MFESNSEGAARHAARATLFVLEATTGPMGLILALVRLLLDLADEQAAADPALLAEVVRRLEVLEVPKLPGRRIPGRQAEILEYLLRRDIAALWTYPGIDEMMAARGLTPKEAAENIAELVELELVHGDPNLNHPSGLARARLHDSAYLRVGSTLLPDVPVVADCLRLMRHLGNSSDYYEYSEGIVETLAIPVTRFDLAARGLVASELIEGGGSGGEDWGTYLHLRLLPLGRRVLRGDDPFIS
ncbi:MAG: hypothetical protein R2910_02470 [Gemmatimonadales bacterium]